MRKNVFLAWVLVFLCFFVSACAKEEEKPKEEKETVEKVTEEFLRYDYNLSEYMSGGEPLGVEAAFDDPTVCTEKEIDDAIFQIMLDNADFAEKSGKAERYDKVKISFTMELDGVLQEKYSREEYEIVIGLLSQEDLECKMGEKLISARVGETRSLLYTYPETATYGEMSGKTVTCYGKVLAIYESVIPECTDEYVKNFEELGLETVAEFRESVKQDILSEKESLKVQAVWSAYLDTVEILEYPEAEVGMYLSTYKDYYVELAEQMDMTLAQFLEEYLETDEESFLKEAEEYARELVKNDMILAYLAQKLEVTLSKEEYDKGAQEYYANEKGEFTSFEEFVAYYTEENIRQNLIWDKALNLVIENAVATE